MTSSRRRAHEYIMKDTLVDDDSFVMMGWPDHAHELGNARSLTEFNTTCRNAAHYSRRSASGPRGEDTLSRVDTLGITCYHPKVSTKCSMGLSGVT